MTFTIQHEENPRPEDISFIGRKLAQFNEESVRPENYERLLLTVRGTKNNVIAGLIGAIFWDMLHIEVLWTDETFRNQGIASKLLKEAEEISVRKNCYLALLDTFDFQAPEFYRKRNYVEVGQVEDWPKGHTKYYFRKKLQ